jgi:hypothetical protein
MNPMHRKATIADLFDDQGCLRSVYELPPEVAAQIASFEVIRVTVRRKRDVTITEELIRVTLRNKTTASVRKRSAGGQIVASVR